MKHLIIIDKPISKNKAWCLQASLHNPGVPSSFFYSDHHLLDDNFYFRSAASLFGAYLSCSIEWSRKRDHAGFGFDLDILGLFISFNIYDSRHWDEENNSWMTYENEK